MGLQDVWNAIRRKAPPAVDGEAGRARTAEGREVDLELYEIRSCPFCQRVFRAIARLGLPVRHRDIDRDPAAARRLVELGGRDQVPCLFVDGEPIYESADIVAFLEKNFGGT